MVPTKPNKSNLSRLFNNATCLLIMGLFGTVLLMILPIRPFLLDGFLAVSIALSCSSCSRFFTSSNRGLTGFPTLLLFITLFRLSLNIASTRLILLDGYAGHIIEAFGILSSGAITSSVSSSF